MGVSELVAGGRGKDECEKDAVPSCVSKKSPDRKRLGCADVARNRAVRYARHYRMPKSLWPLIAAFILVALIFERRPVPVFQTEAERPARDAAPSLAQAGLQNTNERLDVAVAYEESEGEFQSQYRPSARFLANDAAQLIAFLVRNRGRLDNEAARMKWDNLDQISLPVAVYLREVEATGAWDDLKKEISAARYEAYAPATMKAPRSGRHNRILQLMPHWSQRGEELLAIKEPEVEPDPKTIPTIGVGGPDTKPPKP